MSTEAFATRRVREALTAIGDYLDVGVKLAGGIPPGQSVRLDLEPIASTPGPRLTNVLWAQNHSHVIHVGPGVTDLDVLVTGENLAQARQFKLVGAAPESTFFQTRRLDPAASPDTGFTAHMTLTDPTAVSYHAFVVTESGQTFLLRDALEIAESAPRTGLQLGGAIPNEARQGDEGVEIALLLLSGTAADVSKVDVTGTDGVSRKWPIEIVKSAKRLSALKQQYEQSQIDVVLVKLSVPDKEPLDIYTIVATSDSLKSEDKLAFFVLERKK
jgi:hypothetical protein